MSTLQHIAVSYDPTGTKIFEIAVDDIIFIKYERSDKGIWIHTLQNEGYLPGSLEFWLSALSAGGLQHIEQFDRGSAMILTKIELLDAKQKIAYFESLARKEKGCPFAILNYNAVVQALQRINQPFKFI